MQGNANVEGRDTFDRNEIERIRQTRIRRSGIPKRYLGADVDLCDERIQRFAAVFCERTIPGLVLFGPVGTGKTYAACAVLLAVADRATVRFATGSNILREVRSSYKSRGVSEDDIVSRYTGPRVLVVDDIGQEQATDWALSVLLSVLDTRQAAGKTTIYTSQTKSDGILKRLSVHGDSTAAEAIVSRMRECEPIAFSGPDRRVR